MQNPLSLRQQEFCRRYAAGYAQSTAFDLRILPARPPSPKAKPTPVVVRFMSRLLKPPSPPGQPPGSPPEVEPDCSRPQSHRSQRAQGRIFVLP